MCRGSTGHTPAPYPGELLCGIHLIGESRVSQPFGSSHILVCFLWIENVSKPNFPFGSANHMAPVECEASVTPSTGETADSRE